MNIAIVGTGYVGLTTGVCYASLGHRVICVDNNEEKIKQLSKDICPIYEPGLEELMIETREKGNLSFTTDIKQAVNEAAVVMIAVGTPSMSNGSVDMSYVEEVARQIGESIQTSKIVVNKSTVPVGSAEKVRSIVEQFSGLPCYVASVPEFLREGSAVHDIFNAERIVIGVDSEYARDILLEIHEPFRIPVQVTSIKSAELIKYAANSFLALKISFINEIANLAEKVGADIREVSKGIGSDSRIGNKFLNAGIGYGGACFPKDTLGLINIAKQAEHDFALLKETVKINAKQYLVVINKLLKVYPDLSGKTISLLGLAFKPNTDDLREAPSLKIITHLSQLTENIRIRVFDPVAMEQASKIIKEPVQYCSSVEEALEHSDAVIIVTEWKQFIEMNWEMVTDSMNSKVVIDGRNCLKLDNDTKIEYYGVGLS